MLYRYRTGLLLALLSGASLFSTRSVTAQTAVGKPASSPVTTQVAGATEAGSAGKVAPCNGCIPNPCTTCNPTSCDLILNGDFESQTTPPTRPNNVGGGRTGVACPEDIIPSQVANWTSPSDASPDYYSSNATPGNCTGNAFVDADLANQVNPSSAFVGRFQPFSSNSAIGLLYRQAYTEANGTQRTPFAEYVTGALPQTLTAGRYYAQFRVSIAGAASAANSGLSSGFGLYFHNGAPTRTTNRGFLTPPAGPSVLSGAIDGTNINNNNINSWRRVTGQFTASGNEDNVSIGLFNSDPSLFQYLPGYAQDGPRTYMLVDKVELYRIPIADPVTPITNFCQSNTLGSGCTLDAPFTYAWTSSQSGSTVLATTPQLQVAANQTPYNIYYYLTVTMPDGTTHTSIYTLYPCDFSGSVVVDGGGPTNDCSPRVVRAVTNGGTGSYTYTWTSSPASSSPLPNTPTITVTPSVSTTYTVEIVDIGNNNRTTTQSTVVNPILVGSPSVWAPNIFTPNGDGYNDYFRVYDANHTTGPINALGYDLRIFDRWGRLKYQRVESSAYAYYGSGIRGGDIVWSGYTANGAPCADGTYYYYVTFDNCSGNQVDFLRGWVEIIGGFGRAASTTPQTQAMYPNPANEKLTVVPGALVDSDADMAAASNEAATSYSLEVLDKTGVVRLRTTTTKATELDTKALPDGIYFLRVVGSNGKVTTKQLIVDHTR